MTDRFVGRIEEEGRRLVREWDVPKSVFDQLLTDGLIEQHRESWGGTDYKLSESAK